MKNVGHGIKRPGGSNIGFGQNKENMAKTRTIENLKKQYASEQTFPQVQSDNKTFPGILNGLLHFLFSR